jgi:hypothetical protein
LGAKIRRRFLIESVPSAGRLTDFARLENIIAPTAINRRDLRYEDECPARAA